PVFWLGSLIILVFSLQLRWFPVTGQGGLERLVMPATALGIVTSAPLMRLVRGAMLEVMRQDYITTARAKGQHARKVVLIHALRNRGALVGGAILLVLLAAAGGAPWLTVRDPLEMNPPERMLSPDAQHWFGTDNFGRDIFTRVLYGTRISLSMGLISVGLALGISLVSGLLAGYYGGWTDAFVMRAVDVMLAFPGLLLALAI